MQCKATSKQSKKRCRRKAITGGRVCVMHGGKAPQVKKAARERFNDLVDPAINRLEKVINDDAVPTASAVTAAKDILDRAGHKPVEQVEDVTSESTESEQLRGEYTLEQLRAIHKELEARKVVH